MVGMARVVTDRGTFAWLCDVYIDAAHRGGLGTWLLDVVLAHPELTSVRRWLLATSYSHGLYERAGFAAVDPEKFLARLT
jgi:N-acetylglutamate synthase-like GNAT family acetyltransferase